MDRPENRGKRPGGLAGCEDGHAHKRSRAASASAQDDDAFASLLAEAGCELSSSREGQEYEVEDPRRLRRTLEQRLTLNSDLRKNFLAALEEHLQLPGVLHAALKPMRVTTPGLPLTGDSFVRLLLNVAPIQADLAGSLLERLPEFIDEADEEKDVPTLLLGQFRWLDQIQDSHGLMAKLVEVLPVCSVDQQRQALALLPEVAGEEDHAAVLACLEGVLQEEASLVPAALEALANLSLDPDMQAKAVDLALDRFQGADAGDLPTVTRFLLQHAAPANARAVVAALRDSLHFVTITDPRLAVPDVKQKGKVLGGGENPEWQLVEAVRQALQLNPVAADAVLKEARAITEPAKHKTVDLWLLLALHRLNPERRKAVEALLRRKFAEGHAEGAWLERGIVGHEKAMAELFPSLLGLAQQLLPAAAPEVSAAGATLYGALFRGFPFAYNQQEVLRVLHCHLGAAAREEASAALGVLLALARQRLLSGYASFLSSILDHVEGYCDSQVEQVFALFGEIVAAACAERDGGGGGGGGDGSRMEDELFVVLRKQLNSTQPGPRRAGVIGAVSLVQRLGAAAAELGGAAEESAVGKRYSEAHQLLSNAFEGCQSTPESFAFLCDQLTRALGGSKPSSRKLLMDLESNLLEVLEGTFVGDASEGEGAVVIGARPVAASMLWNLDGSMTPCCLDFLPLLAREVAPGGAVQRSPLLFLFSMIRLVAAVEHQAKGNLAAIDAMLGCPVKLFSLELVEPSRFVNLEPDQQRVVLTGAFYMLNWCRELANTFALQLDPTGARSPSEKADLKLFSRLRLACQLEAVLNRLLPMAPPLFALPSVSAVGMPAGGALPAAVAAPKSKKGGAGGGGKGGGKGGKSVKFQGGDAGAGGSKGPARSKSSGGQVTQTTSGNSQGTATQAASGAPADGLDRLALERWKMRSLLLPALSVLSVGTDVSPGCYGMLAPASYLLGDLQQKLAAVLAPPKRPSFLRPAAAAAKLQPDVASLTVAEVLAAVRPVLGPLRRHLDTAVIAVSEGLQDDYMEREDRKNVWEVTGAGLTQSSNDGTEATSADFLSGIDDCAVAVAAVSPSAAAERLICQALNCIKQLLSYPGITLPANRPALQDLLAAFDIDEAQAAGDEAWSVEELLKACRRAFHYFSCKVTDDDEAAKVPLPFQAAHATLQVMQAITAVAVTISQSEGLSVKSSKAVRKLSARVASGAEAMMRRSWDAGGSVGGTVSEGDGQGWRGRGPALGELLRLWISRSAEPLEVVATIAGDLLLKVTDKLGPKAGAEWVAPYPSLSGNSISVWYREAWEALLAAWDAVVAAAASAEKDASLLDDAGRGAVVAQCQRCAAAFGQLMEVVKSQEKRVPIHTQAVKAGGRFVEAFLRLLPFWATAFAEHQQSFQATVKEIQKGTRTIQVLCSEGKFRKELPLAARVPQVKRTLERFVFAVKAFLVERGRADSFQIGALKHKSLRGAVMPSQLHEEEEDGSDGDEEEEDEEEGGEGEDEGCGESQAQSDQEEEEEE